MVRCVLIFSPAFWTPNFTARLRAVLPDRSPRHPITILLVVFSLAQRFRIFFCCFPFTPPPLVSPFAVIKITIADSNPAASLIFAQSLQNLYLQVVCNFAQSRFLIFLRRLRSISNPFSPPTPTPTLTPPTQTVTERQTSNQHFRRPPFLAGQAKSRLATSR